MQHLWKQAKILSKRVLGGALQDGGERLGSCRRMLGGGEVCSWPTYVGLAAIQWTVLLVAFFATQGSEQVILAVPWVIPAITAAAAVAGAGASVYSAVKGPGGGLDVGQYDTMTPEQQRYLRYAMGELQDLMGSPPPTKVGARNRRDPGMPMPGLDPLEGLSLAAMQVRAMSGVDMGLINQGQQALSKSLALGPEDYEQFFQESVEEPFLESTSRITDALARKYAGRARSSEAAGAESQHMRDAMTALARARGQMGMDIEANRLKALTQVGPMSGAPLDYLGRLLGAGGTGREAAWQQYGAAERETQRNLQIYFNQIAALTPLGTAPSFENIGYAQPYQQSPDYGGMVGSTSNALNSALMMYMMNQPATTSQPPPQLPQSILV